MTTRIRTVAARRIWDSRGRPTVEAEVTLEGGAVGRGIAPAGASRGSREAVDLRDGGTHLGGFDVTGALANVRGPIAEVLVGRDACDQADVDAALIALDGTTTKERLGGNATIATSLAVLHASASANGLPLYRHLAGDHVGRLPLPQIQIFGGGAHAGRRVDVQDFLIMPLGAATFDEAMVFTSRVYAATGAVMAERGPLVGVAEEGGFWPAFDHNEDALSVLTKGIERAGLRPFEDVGIALDVAASEFGRGGTYTLGLDGKRYETDAWIDVLAGWIDRYPIISIEDPVAEDDVVGMRAFTARFGERLQIIGDDYLVTRAALVEEAAANGACNAVLVKPNQAGTVTETYEALRAGKRLGYGTIVSARSGETEDTTIAHLAVGWDAGQLKVGSFTRSERMAKWNETLRIEEELGGAAKYAGKGAFAPGVRSR